MYVYIENELRECFIVIDLIYKIKNYWLIIVKYSKVWFKLFFWLGLDFDKYDKWEGGWWF